MTLLKYEMRPIRVLEGGKVEVEETFRLAFFYATSASRWYRFRDDDDPPRPYRPH